MKSKDATALEIIELRGTRKFVMPIPVQIPNEREIVRRATREVDRSPLNDRKFSKFQKRMMWMCALAGVTYLALYFRAFDWIWELLTQ